MMLPGLKRNRAGHYSGEDNRGRFLTVEYMTTGYGDSGWVWWIERDRSDYPVNTARQAYKMLVGQLAYEHTTIKREG